ncbi:GNAT family N-acetyltransferase [Bacillus sp. Bva_UNVM-123]|uniref:GNAT family N-acetyltransferase n=1 Tax=Bacillus sp. Bva_UNVM-123 TaxID=2829798 RepID=UPI00391FC537
MGLSLKKLCMEDAEALFAFELNNKTFFEEMVPTRGEDYYQYEVFLSRLEALLDEQTQGKSYFYLIKDHNDTILGRMNIVDIKEAQGELGYRVGQLHTGKGIASKALKLLIGTIVEEGQIQQLNAKTTSNNIASQKVLEKNGFEEMDTRDETVQLNGQSLKFVNYRWRK